MNDSLSVILPVHNSQASLGRQVHEILELLPDLTSRFELLIVDDGSTDHTEEVASELARMYPQVRVARHPRRHGTVSAVETGLVHTTGDVVFVQDPQSPLSHTDLRRLWELRSDDQLVFARPQELPAADSPAWLRRLLAWGQGLRKASAKEPQRGLQMIRRGALEGLLAGEFSRQSAGCKLPLRRDSAEPAKEVVSHGPKFLARLRDFTLGE